jgi:peroxiredoxin
MVGMHLRTVLVLANLGLTFHLLAAEAPKPNLTRPRRPEDFQAIFTALDKDQNEKVSKAEAGDVNWFSRIDRNNDGEITRKELNLVISILTARDNGGLDGRFSVPGVAPVESEESLRQGPKILRAADRGVGRLLPDLSYKDIKGKKGKLSDFKSAPALVIAYTTTSCPLAKKYAPTLTRLEKEFGARGVKFLFINPTASDSRASINAAIKDQGFSSAYVHDRDGKFTAGLGAETTTEIFVLDAARTLVFRGAVDDQFGFGYSLDAPRHNFLTDALTAMLAGEMPLVAATDAPGCVLNIKPATALAQKVTYHNRISRVVQNNCLECHRDGGVGPFSLAKYEDVTSHAAMMRRQVERGLMPPWFAGPNETNAVSHWANDRSLSPADKQDLLTWLVSDKPLGNPTDAPLPIAFTSEWTIGKPDAVFQLPDPVAIKAQGTMPYQFVTVETSYPEDRWVNAYEIIPTAREVVHHVIVMVHTGRPEKPDEGDGSEGYWAAYVPGNASRIMPAGFGKKLPAGATISFQIHYTPNGKATQDQLKLGVKFAKEPPRYAVHVLALPKPNINIPAGAAHHVEVAEKRVPADLNLTALMAHTHVRGKAFKFELAGRDGQSETLLDIPKYDFNWQLRYEYAQTKRIPAGSLVKITAVYDNSADNPANPDPTKNVRWGNQTYDEMMIGYFECYSLNPTLARDATSGR